MAVNTTVLTRAPWADVAYAGDHAWWEKYHQRVALETTVEEKWTVSPPAQHRFGLRLAYGVPHAKGLATEPGRINLGGNSGYQAVGLAYQLGAKRIVLIGFDMQRTYGRSHHHGDHPRPLGNGNNFRGWIERFARMATDLTRLGVEVVNATRETALTCFPRMTIQEALNGQADRTDRVQPGGCQRPDADAGDQGLRRRPAAQRRVPDRTRRRGGRRVAR